MWAAEPVRCRGWPWTNDADAVVDDGTALTPPALDADADGDTNAVIARPPAYTTVSFDMGSTSVLWVLVMVS